jgi:hypothetical protein
LNAFKSSPSTDDPHVAGDTEAPHDDVADGGAAVHERLVVERKRMGRGTLQTRRRLWAFCREAFREWAGVTMSPAAARAVHVTVRPLGPHELAEWIRVAQELPAVARELLAMRRTVDRNNGRIQFRAPAWSDARVADLIELTSIAMLGTQDERARAEARYLRLIGAGAAKTESCVVQAARMLTACIDAHAGLAANVDALKRRSRAAPALRAPRGAKKSRNADGGRDGRLG